MTPAAIYKTRTRVQAYASAAFFVLAFLHPSPGSSQTCSGNSPAFVVDQDLWLDGVFRPGLTNLAGNRIPQERDSTDWGSLTIPGANSGHELFWGVDVLGDYLFVAYNAGVQVWSISENGGSLPRAENPLRLIIKDGWRGDFLSFPTPHEGDFFIEDIDVLQGPGSTVYVALSGKHPAGMSVWKFDTNNETLTTLYQNSKRSSRQVRLVDTSSAGDGSQIYVFSSRENSVEMYDITQAEQLPGPCDDNQLTPEIECPGVHLGNVRGATVDLASGGYLDAMRLPTGEVYLGVSDDTENNANSIGFNLWQVNLSNPQESIRRFDGLDPFTFGVAFFSLPGSPGSYFLGAIERDGANNWVRFFDLSNCLTSSCSTLPRVGQQIARPPAISRQFLTFSTSNGTPFIYYGVEAPSIIGPKRELLLNVSNLDDLREMTDGGPTYLDICTNQEIGYWGWYYSRNQFGFDNFTPTIGRFHPTRNIFYRAAVGMFDVHVWEGSSTSSPVIDISLDPGQGDLWFDEAIGFSASAQNCAGAESWTWSDDDTFASIIDDNGAQADFTFATCGSNAECPTRDIEVSAVKNACSGHPNLVVNSVLVSVGDPRAFIDGIEVSPPGNTFPAGTVLTFDTNPNPPRGRAPFGYAWSVRTGGGVEILSGTGPSFTWDTSILEPIPEIFSDGFESGTASAWSSSLGLPFGGTTGTETAPRAPGSSPNPENPVGGSVFTVEVGVSNQGGAVTHTETIQITIESL